MPSRKLPNSNPKRYRALRIINTLLTAVPAPLIIPFLPATIVRFNTFFPNYKTKFLAVATALGSQTTLTRQVDDAELLAKYFIWDFLDALIRATRRGTFDRGILPSYHLSEEHPLVPHLTGEQDIIDWGDYIHEAETNRIAGGGTAVSFPSLAEVDAAVGNFNSLNVQQAAVKTAYDTAQEELDALDDEADKLILKLWNEIEAAFDEGNKPSMRRKAREWGVYYVPASGEVLDPDEFSIIGKISEEGAASTTPLADALVTVVETGSTSVSESNGDYFIATQLPGTYTIQVEKAGYATKTITGVVVTAGAITTQNIQLTNKGTAQGTVTQAGVGAAASVSIDGTTFVVNTNPGGGYSIPNIPAGTYTIRASLTSNPALIISQPLIITAGGTVTVDFVFP